MRGCCALEIEIARSNTLSLGAAWNGRCCIYDTDEAFGAEGTPQLEAKLKMFESYTLRESVFTSILPPHIRPIYR